MFLAVFLPALALYIATVAPSLPTGDSGELITAAATLGVAHPPGYPLYVWVGRLWLALLPWGSAALKLNLMSSVAGALAAGLVALAVRRLSQSALAGLAAGWLLAVSAPQWNNSIVAEVFAPNAALAAAGLLALVTLLGHSSPLKPLPRGARRNAPPARVGGVPPVPPGAAPASRSPVPWLVLALLSTLLLSLHHTLFLLMLPCVVVALAVPSLRPRSAERGGAIAAAVTGLLPLLHMPLAARSSTALVWGDESSLRGFLRQLLRADYGTFQLAPQGAGAVSGDSHGWLYLASLPAAMGGCAVVLALVGAVAAIRHHRALAIALGGFALLQALFFMRAGLPADIPVMRSVIERFYLLPNVLVALLAGLGFASLSARLPANRFAAASLALLVAVQPLVATARHLGPRGNHFAEHAGLGILNSVPRGGVLFVRGDLQNNAIEYLTRVEHLRADITMVNQELLTYDWYVRQLRARFPGLLPALGGAQRIMLRDGRAIDGWTSRRSGGKLALLEETVNSLVDSIDVESISPLADPSRAFATTRADFRENALLPPADDRYSGLPASRNLLWLDHLTPRRSVSFFGIKEDSWRLGYEMVPEGLVLRAYPLGSVPSFAEQVSRQLELARELELDDYFRPWPVASFEATERRALAYFVTRALLLLCQPAAAALKGAPEADAGRARLISFAERFESIEPTPDPACLRAIALLRLYDERFRDLARARIDLDRYLATAPPGSEGDEARALRSQLGS